MAVQDTETLDVRGFAPHELWSSTQEGEAHESHRMRTQLASRRLMAAFRASATASHTKVIAALCCSGLVSVLRSKSAAAKSSSLNFIQLLRAAVGSCSSHVLRQVLVQQRQDVAGATIVVTAGKARAAGTRENHRPSP